MRTSLFQGGVGVTLAAASLAWASVASATITIETVPVGNAGNVADSTGYGQVNYVYNIGKYEVTAAQYAEFLNAVAKFDNYGLYNTEMPKVGISRTGISGSYTYKVDENWVDRPVGYVSFWDSCRFANWLQNGQPVGPQGPGTTETGSYEITSSKIGWNSVTRGTSAGWVVASENEWYKAAYYKGGGTNTGYWLYPTKSDTPPGKDIADVSGNNANYYTTPYDIPGTSWLTIGGEFQNSAGPYGTFDQGGNLNEWTDTTRNEGQNFIRIMRGGAYSNDVSVMESTSRGGNAPERMFQENGFRLVQLPEPTSLGLLGVCVTGLLLRRRR